MWTISIPPGNASALHQAISDFVEGDGEFGNMGWDFVKPRVTTFTIWIVDESEMWIDDVILYGVNRDNFN